MEHRHLVLEERVRGDGWDDDAIVADSTTGVFADPSKIREVDFRGEYFTSCGRHFVPPSPQRRPVLWQAGASEQGREFTSLVRFESALAIMSGHTGVDFSQFDLDDDIAELVVPELQERARFRTTYSGTTLRANLLED